MDDKIKIKSQTVVQNENDMITSIFFELIDKYNYSNYEAFIKATYCVSTYICYNGKVDEETKFLILLGYQHLQQHNLIWKTYFIQIIKYRYDSEFWDKKTSFLRSFFSEKNPFRDF